MPENSSPTISGSNTNPWAWALLLFLLGLTLRLIPVLASPNLGIGLDDMFQYDMLARSLAEGEGFRWYAAEDLRLVRDTFQQLTDRGLSVPADMDPEGVRTSFRAPLYPAFLSLIYRSVELANRFFAARIVQAAVMATLGPLAFLLARELSARFHYSLAAGLLVTTWPLLVSLPLALATENLFLPLTAAGTLLLLRKEQGGSRWLPVFAGVTFGMAALTRSVILGFPALVAAWYWLRGERRQAALLVLPIILMAAPWAVRNSLLHGQPTMIESSLGYNLYLGYHPENNGTFKFGPSLDLITILDDAERDLVGRAQALAFIRQDPLRVPELMLWKLGHFWGLEDRAFSYLYSNSLLGDWPPALVAGTLVFISVPLMISLPLALAAWSMTQRDRAWQLLTLLFTWYIGIHLLIMAEERFHLALLPMMVGLAARGLSQWPQVRRRLKMGDPVMRRRLLLAGLLVMLAFANWGLEIGRNFEQYRTLIQPGGWQIGLHY
ncbi:MAG: glycosyltransferase family 39 protein [Anaerolineales bacterium]